MRKNCVYPVDKVKWMSCKCSTDVCGCCTEKWSISGMAHYTFESHNTNNHLRCVHNGSVLLSDLVAKVETIVIVSLFFNHLSIYLGFHFLNFDFPTHPHFSILVIAIVTRVRSTSVFIYWRHQFNLVMSIKRDTTSCWWRWWWWHKMNGRITAKLVQI